MRSRNSAVWPSANVAEAVSKVGSIYVVDILNSIDEHWRNEAVEAFAVDSDVILLFAGIRT